MIFEIDSSDKEKIDDWLHGTVYPAIIAEQKKNIKEPTSFHEMCWEDGYPYEGAIGGGLTFKFTPTSIGVISKALYITQTEKYELDLTNYDLW